MTRARSLTPRAQEAADIVHAAGGGISRGEIAAQMHCRPATATQHLTTARVCGLIYPRSLGRGCLWFAGPQSKAAAPLPRVNSIWQLASLCMAAASHG